MTWTLIQGSPAAPPPRASHAEAASVPSANLKAPPLRLLIVDDEPSICKALAMSFSRTDSIYSVIAAQSGESALSIIRNEHVDVMLIDLRIPDMRGDVIFEVAVSHQPHLRYQTLFMTGDITDRARSLIQACRCHHLVKPFDLRVMAEAIFALAPRIHEAAG
jgi:DNA-binding NtrC family response regulator